MYLSQFTIQRVTFVYRNGNFTLNRAVTLTTWSALGWCRNVNEVCSSPTAAASTLRRSRRWEAKLSALAILIAYIVTIGCRKVLYVATSLAFDICCYNCSNHIHSLVYIKNIHMYRSTEKWDIANAASLASYTMLTVACCHSECCVPSELELPRLPAMLYIIFCLILQ